MCILCHLEGQAEIRGEILAVLNASGRNTTLSTSPGFHRISVKTRGAAAPQFFIRLHLSAKQLRHARRWNDLPKAMHARSLGGGNGVLPPSLLSSFPLLATSEGSEDGLSMRCFWQQCWLPLLHPPYTRHRCLSCLGPCKDLDCPKLSGEKRTFFLLAFLSQNSPLICGIIQSALLSGCMWREEWGCFSQQRSPPHLLHLSFAPVFWGMCLIILALKILPDLFLVIHRRNCLPSGELLRLTDVSIFASHVVQVDLEDLTVFVQGCLVTLASWALLHIFSSSDWAAFCLEIHIYTYI